VGKSIKLFQDEDKAGPGPNLYYRTPGTDVCLSCPLPASTCDEMNAPPRDIRRRSVEPRCLLAVAIWHKVDLDQAEVIARRTLNGQGPDEYRRQIADCSRRGAVLKCEK
jgi:hypothetical protein